MEISCKVYNYNKRCFQVEWVIGVPRVGESVVTGYIYPVTTGKYYFKFTSECCPGEQNEMWKIDLMSSIYNKNEGSFLLTVHVRGKGGRNVFTSYKEIKDPKVNYEVWRFNRKSFFRSYSDVDFSANTLAFIFTFDYGIRSYQDLPREDKSVQTCNPPSPPKYIDDRQCLENLSLDFRKLMDDDSDPDVRLKCGDCTIPAHRLILGARSDVFRTMLQSDMLEGREGSVEIVDMEPEIFQIFIRYLYTGLLPELSVPVALPLFEAADKYHVEALRSRCSDFLAENLTRGNACEILTAADAHSDENLKDRVISYILEENIPSDEKVWPKFWNSNLKLAFEVLSRAYKESVCSRFLE